jgi:uncharacterized protein (TIGR01777 family)
MRVIAFGATGFIGKVLIERLKQRGHEVVVSDWRRDKNWESELFKSDAVINLAGTPVFGRRWSTEFKASIYDSRIEGTRKLVQALAKAKTNGGKVQALVNASAIGFYGPTTGEEPSIESSASGADFLAFVCRDWETEAFKAQQAHGIRTALVRIGIVLGKGGGALQKLLPPFKLGLGGPIGLGRQYQSWVHIEDVVGILIHALENNQISGPINAASPNPVTNKEFSQALAKSLHRPCLFPVPAMGLFVLVGEAAEILVTGQRVLPEVALKTGYKFQYPEIQAAFDSIVRA